MNFNTHYNLEGRHAFLSPSNYHWVNYSDQKLDDTFNNFMATQRGTRLHALAAECIELGIKLPKSRTTLNMYVNDAIGYRMTPEQPLYFSDNCFGTADAISFNKNFLRIHDLKTGVTPASMTQLKIYMAIFCLEYNMKPLDFGAELRIYQSNDINIEQPDPDEIAHIMSTIKTFDSRINAIRNM